MSRKQVTAKLARKPSSEFYYASFPANTTVMDSMKEF